MRQREYVTHYNFLKGKRQEESSTNSAISIKQKTTLFETLHTTNRKFVIEFANAVRSDLLSANTH